MHETAEHKYARLEPVTPSLSDPKHPTIAEVLNSVNTTAESNIYIASKILTTLVGGEHGVEFEKYNSLSEAARCVEVKGEILREMLEMIAAAIGVEL